MTGKFRGHHPDRQAGTQLSPPALQLFRQALTLQQQGHVGQAQGIYQAIVKLQPRHFDSLHLLGISHLQTGNLQAGVEWIAKAIGINPDFAPAHNNLGTALLDLNRPQEALASFDRALAVQPEFAAAHCNRGITLLALGQPDAALAGFDRALAIQPDFAQAHSNRGNALLALRRPEAALASFDQALAGDPQFAPAHYNRGNTLLELGQPEAALTSFNQALAINPHYADAYANRGNTLRALNRLEVAAASYNQALAINPHCAGNHYNLGNVLQTLDRLDEALASFDRALTLQPDYAAACNNRGHVLQALQRFDEALASFDRALTIQPDYAEACNNRGNTLQQLNRHAEALTSFEQALALQPDYAEAHYNHGNALQQLKQLDAALISFDRALTIRPDFAEAHANRGNTLQELNRLDEALASFERALAIQPDYAEAHYNAGNALQQLQRLDAALASFDRALAIRPDFGNAHWNKALTLLLTGNYEKGWELYEWRWRAADLHMPGRQFPQPLWLGAEPLADRTILLHAEQGLGDNIQFCRYVGLVVALGARVLLEAPPALLGLFAGLAGVGELIAAGDALPDFDYHCPLLSLPLAFRTRADSIPSPGSYLNCDADRQASWRLRLGETTRPRIGLAWSGSASHKNDRHRSLSLSELLAHLPPQYDYVCLQKEVRDADRAALAASPVRQYADRLHDFADTAALCGLLDLVISVDTSVAHLAGALGRPTWILLPYAPDWRWQLRRSDSPWYASASLYRQTEDRSWQPVLQRVAEDLREFAGQL